MNKHLLALSVSAVFGMLAACSDVKFNKAESINCQGLGSGACASANGIDSFGPYSIKFTGGKVDILFVDDNSASMSFEQSKIAARFANFIQRLDSRQVDYRIAVTTTDIESTGNAPRAINGNGARQNGRLIQFGDGSYYITPATTNREGLFSQAIQRSETLSCESFMRSEMNNGPSWRTGSYQTRYEANCPSTDERGVHAPNLTILNNYNSFIRSDANLAVILISDEEARSNMYYPLESLDQPATFAANMASKYPNKAWNFHSIIVLDTACMATQSNQIVDPYGVQVVSGTVGHTYAQFGLQMRDELNRPRGVLADICANDYTTPLVDNIAVNIMDRLDEIMLNCENPVELTVSPSNITWTRNKRLLKISPRPAAGTNVTVSYKCRTIDSL